jgi:hypothetical protein
MNQALQILKRTASIIACCCVCIGHSTLAQAALQQASPNVASEEARKKEVITVIQTMFDGMRAGDSAKVRGTFHAAAGLHTTSNRENKPTFRAEAAEEFFKAVAAPKPAGVVYDERILSYDVRIDDNMASVWTPYQFYIGDKLNHCGVNAFHLVRTEQGWKITHITDTRRKQGCGEK